MHTLDIQMRFNDIDQMGHVNNAVIMEYFDLGKEAFFTQHGLPPEEGDFTVMIVHYEVDFVQQLRFHNKVAVATTVERFGNKSLTLRQSIVDAQGTVYATCNTVMAGYSRTQKCAAVIPPTVKERLMSA
ncbi:MAG: acyl-CoA thioesterase [Bacteroidales bacterium]|nr:acyl-CoA thioesterase [Bacteroidales bacterium]MBR1850660.1 acyl-CoA thioesterase [Bacteroidales bacterium]